MYARTRVRVFVLLDSMHRVGAGTSRPGGDRGDRRDRDGARTERSISHRTSAVEACAVIGVGIDTHLLARGRRAAGGSLGNMLHVTSAANQSRTTSGPSTTTRRATGACGWGRTRPQVSGAARP